MFERVKKDDNVLESEDTSRPEAPKTFGSSRSKSASSDPAVIGRSIRISGDLRGDEDLRIEGDVSGTVELRNSALTIGKEGRVKADVYAKAIAVDGEIKGDLYATERVSVHVHARVQGNIISPRVSIEEGAHFKGSIEMNPAAVEKALGKVASTGDDKPATGKPAADSKTAKAAPAKAAGDAGAKLNPPAGTA